MSAGISFVIPAYNEQEVIVATVERVRDALGGLDEPFEIIVVDDGSTDETYIRAERLEDVSIVRHPVNTGYGSAIKTGILHAEHDWIGIVDADGTYAIEELPQLVGKMHEGFDMAVAARTNVLSLDRPAKRLFRRALIAFLNFVISARIVDPNSGFRIFSKDLALTFFPFLCNTFSFTTSITIFALGEGFFVSYVPMHYSKRVGRTKVRHFRDSLRMAQLILQGVTFFNPVKFYLMLVVFLVFFVGAPAVVIALWAGLETLALHYGIIGATATLLIGIGVLGDIIRISASNQPNNDEVKRRWKLRHRTQDSAAKVRPMDVAK